ncbi:MAG: hypothetical protein FRX48_02668 [Lasallia pustulata]|uniref:Mg2+ transporter protein, CorA-like/Zinc transport protein ZntB n=1 Tax=Lasallia pustulata TaxID=136370 RepID=A0A5M8PXA9_9LECA|nr:MAG: hypothetical protein FRX48_02668 [Lasallia pustulata]
MAYPTKPQPNQGLPLSCISATPNYASYQNPHTAQAENPYGYYIGTIYERMRELDSGEYETYRQDDGPYLRHIRYLAGHGWPQLRYLADFIDCSTVAIKSKVLVAEDKKERLQRHHVAVLDFGNERGVKCRKFKSPDSPQKLSEFLDSGSWPDERNLARLIVVEDLSSVVVEMLGSRYDINPQFFRGQLGDYTWFNTRDPWVETPALDSHLKSQSFLRFRYVQPRYLVDGESIKRARRQAGSFNVLRRIDFDTSNKVWADAEGSDVGLVRCSTSVWVRPNVSPDHGWLGVLLLDPTITEGFPLWGGYGNLHVPPGMNQYTHLAGKPSWNSTIDDFIYWVMSMNPDQLQTLDQDPEYITSAVYDFMACQWLLLFDYITTRLSQIEWEIESEPFRTLEGLDGTLQKFHPWRRRIPLYNNFIRSMLDLLEDRFLSPESTRAHWSKTTENVRHLLGRLEEVQNRADHVISVLTAVILIQESKKALTQTRDVSRITYLAFLFVPMSFVATFLSMNNNFPSGNNMVYWIYFVIALPLSGTALLLAYYWTRVEDLWKRTFGSPQDPRQVVGPMPKS